MPPARHPGLPLHGRGRGRKRRALRGLRDLRDAGPVRRDARGAGGPQRLPARQPWPDRLRAVAGEGALACGRGRDARAAIPARARDRGAGAARRCRDGARAGPLRELRKAARAGRRLRVDGLEPALPGPAARAAYLYHVSELSQAEVAARLGVSRATVHNLLREARETGLVRVSFDPHLLGRADQARDLATAYGLEQAVVLPSDDPEAALRAAAGMVPELVPQGATLGVAWGETVYRLAQRLPQMRRPDLTIVQMVGSMASPYGFNAEDCSTLIAARLGAACVNLHAPAVLSDPSLVARLAREPIIARQLDTLARCDAALFAVGLASRESHIVQSGVADLDTLADYHGRGAAGVVAGRFIDGEGRPMSGSLDGRLIGIPPEGLLRIPRRIVVTFGAARADALAAALRGGFATHLVTDAAAAEAMAPRLPVSPRDAGP
ncbi:MarR family transcriptional regulator [Jannaschia formosa]|nr:MarR family transcriptional regulator [Jannaschia formosa]